MQKIVIPICKHAKDTKSVLSGLYRVTDADAISILCAVRKNHFSEPLNDANVPVTIAYKGTVGYVPVSEYVNKNGKTVTRDASAKFVLDFAITISKDDKKTHNLDKSDVETIISDVRFKLVELFAEISEQITIDAINCTELMGGIQYQKAKIKAIEHMVANKTDSIGSSDVPLLN